MLCCAARWHTSYYTIARIGWLAKLPDTSDDKPDSNKVVLGYKRMDIIYSKQQGGITLALMIITVVS